MVYQLAKKMLDHRAGTEYEDMYWIDLDTLTIVAEELNAETPVVFHPVFRILMLILKMDIILGWLFVMMERFFFIQRKRN